MNNYTTLQAGCQGLRGTQEDEKMDEMDKRACALEDQQERGFWAVIPASVLHDRQLSASAVRLYGEISGGSSPFAVSRENASCTWDLQ